MILLIGHPSVQQHHYRLSMGSSVFPSPVENVHANFLAKAEAYLSNALVPAKSFPKSNTTSISNGDVKSCLSISCRFFRRIGPITSHTLWAVPTSLSQSLNYCTIFISLNYCNYKLQYLNRISHKENSSCCVHLLLDVIHLFLYFTVFLDFCTSGSGQIPRHYPNQI